MRPIWYAHRQRERDVDQLDLPKRAEIACACFVFYHIHLGVSTRCVLRVKRHVSFEFEASDASFNIFEFVAVIVIIIVSYLSTLAM